MKMTARFTAWTAACGVVAALVVGSASSVVESAPPTSEPQFEASVEPIGEQLAAEMRAVSWRPECPVPISDLRLITMNHWGFDGQVHTGELVVHADVADDIVGVFDRLFDVGYPIRRMERIEHYAGDDDASMAADNTSAFNCRPITGGGAFSVHSWGKAIDINPVENPYVKGDIVLPEAGQPFVDRNSSRPGVIVDGDVVVEAFAAIGFVWGGDWTAAQGLPTLRGRGSQSGSDGGAAVHGLHAERWPVPRADVPSAGWPSRTSSDGSSGTATTSRSMATSGR